MDLLTSLPILGGDNLFTGQKELQFFAEKAILLEASSNYTVVLYSSFPKYALKLKNSCNILFPDRSDNRQRGDAVPDVTAGLGDAADS